MMYNGVFGYGRSNDVPSNHHLCHMIRSDQT